MGIKKTLSSATALFLLAATSFAALSDPLSVEQWGLENNGADQWIDAGGLESITVRGRAGEDIGLTRLPPGALQPKDPKRTIVVAVLDTGLDLSHPDLKDAVLSKPSECEALARYDACLKKQPKATCDSQFGSVDTDGNGYPMDCNGWNLIESGNGALDVYGSPKVTDRQGHGTHVAGVIAAQINGVGIQGIAPHVKILPVKVFGDSRDGMGTIKPTATTPDQLPPVNGPLPSPAEKDLKLTKNSGDLIARGLLYAIRSNVDVINMSFGWPAQADSLLIRRLIEIARARGITVVTAAGNDSTDALIMPCLYEGVVCVAAHGPDGALTSSSNHGPGVDIAAPGLNILSSWPMAQRPTRFNDRQGWDFKDGTSMAAPFVAGSIARLLDSGIPRDEAIARLRVGARPHRPSEIRSPFLAPKQTWSGNLDLVRALEARPQPLILPASKEKVRLAWDRVSATLPLSFSLKNFWAPAKSVRVHLALLEDGIQARNARLRSTELTLSDWGSGDSREIRTQLEITDPRVESEIRIQVRIEADRLPARGFIIPAEITVKVTRDLRDPGLVVQNVEGLRRTQPGSRMEIRSVISADGQNRAEYVVIETIPGSRVLTLLAPKKISSGYSAAATGSLTSSDSTVLEINRTLSPVDRSPVYIVTERLPLEKGKTVSKMRFTYLSRELAPVYTLEYSPEKAILGGSHEWLNLGTRLTPAWISRGFTPDADKEAFDPWKPKQTDTPTVRFYYLSDNGIRSISAPSQHFFLSILPLSDEQKAQGIVPVLIGKGTDYLLEYFVGEVIGTELKNLKPLAFDAFRMLEGTQSDPILSLSAQGGSAGIAFSSAAVRTTQRTSWKLNDGSEVDATLTPVNTLDSVAKVAGTFSGGRVRGAFTQTLNEIQYHDLVGSTVVATTAKRFSFLPGTYFVDLYTPIVIQSERQRVPGLYIAGNLGHSASTEVIVPEFDASGTVLALGRPARFRLEAGAGCQDLANPIPADASGPARLVFFCGDRLIQIPLAY